MPQRPPITLAPFETTLNLLPVPTSYPTIHLERETRTWNQKPCDSGQVELSLHPLVYPNDTVLSIDIPKAAIRSRTFPRVMPRISAVLD